MMTKALLNKFYRLYIKHILLVKVYLQPTRFAG